MNRHLIYQLLKIFNHNGNIMELVYDGYEFGQITRFLDDLQDYGYISTNDDRRIIVTDKGSAFISEFESEYSIKNQSKWILPRSEMWRKPIGKNDIYIPKK